MISAIQAQAIGAIAGARIVAFCDARRDAAEARAKALGGKAYSRVEEMVTNPAVDAVSICTPSGMHLEPAVVAADAKKHVMVEKPIEISVDRADAIIEACRRNGVKLGAIFPRRSIASSQALKTAIRAARFGTIALADVYIKWHRTNDYYAGGGWRGTYRYDGGGALMNQGIHGVDLLQWLMGGVDEVKAFTATRAHPGIEVEDVAVAALRFRSGAVGVIEASTASWPGDKLRIEISGSAGSVVLEDEAIRAWRFRDPHPEDEAIRAKLGPVADSNSGGATDPNAIDSAGHQRQFEDFIAAIRDDRPPAIDGAEARSSVAIISAIYRSAREQCAVRVAG